MAKTKEELNIIRNEIEAMNKKLQELTEEELKQVVGGQAIGLDISGVIGTAVASGVLLGAPDRRSTMVDPTDIKPTEIVKHAQSDMIYGIKDK